MQTAETDTKPPTPERKKIRFGHLANKWFYREKTRHMPRMRNLSPYDSNEIVRWFSELYQCDLATGARHFRNARILSAQAARADPIKWPPFLVFDHDTREWHGADILVKSK
jgi:hypothetical protein